MKPKVIFLDAVGTLFGIRGSVGELYGNIARQFGVEVSTPVLNHAFVKSFQATPPLAFPDAAPDRIQALEYEWWNEVAQQTFQRAGVLEQFKSFRRFFTHLYDYFATAEPWIVYEDTAEFLEELQKMDVDLGVLSNFDSRIYQVLETLKLADFFQTVTISSEVGAAKPDPKIFAAALAKHRCEPSQAWHVGDSFREDYEGARAAGLRGIWLRRSSG
ncbi:MAG: HAD family hydrolase [Coleofasciculaceae cyanobacterium SM2_3_26]|nr:HAD family hydrolase [Coleofasciculaceae cyanobacterium SM2_3_26]